MNTKKDKNISIRKMELNDLKEINLILNKTYPGAPAYSKSIIESQLNIFPDGQFVILVDGRVVGFCMTQIVHEKEVTEVHTWKSITDGGLILKHNPNGNYLYGVDICVDPTFRGKKIGSRLYDERKRLCQRMGLNGIMFGARLAGLAKKLRLFGTVEEYLKAVEEKKIKDPDPNSFESVNEIERDVGRKYMDEDINNKENPYGLTEFDLEEIDEMLNTGRKK